MIQKESQNKFEIKMGIDDLDPNDRQNVTNTDDKQTEKGLNYVTSRTTKNAPTFPVDFISYLVKIVRTRYCTETWYSA